VSAGQAQLDQLRRVESEQRQIADSALTALAGQIISAYKHGSVDPALALLSSRSPREAAQRVEFLTMIARRNQADLESASSARISTHANAVLTEQATTQLRAQQAELDDLRKQVEAEVARAQQVEDQVEAQIASREGRAGGPSGAAAGAAAPVSGSIACPVGTPRHYSDTYGAPRSGGRSHKGVDILASRGTPIYAYESGTVTRMSSNSLGGISLYLNGASGNVYYYTHLRGYVSGIRPGTRVSAGQHIAFTGDTGNARGIPHLHWEVRPGGGGNVNPYPYARRVCG